MSAPHMGQLGLRSFLRRRTRGTSLEIFRTYRIALAQGLWPLSQKPSQVFGGAVTRLATP